LLSSCAIIIMSCLLYVLAYVHGFMSASVLQIVQPNTNVLNVKQIKPIPSSFEIAINPPAALNGFTKSKVYQIRSKMVLQHPELIFGTYKPSDAVFGQIIDEKPWWGIIGQFFYGSGQYSTYGDSEESRFILNPFLLASPEFYGFTFYEGGRFRWRQGVTRDALEQAKFPFYCHPHDLKWYPQSASAEVTYDVASYLSMLNKYAAYPLEIEKDGTFELMAYNARDLGCNYVFTPPNGSINVVNDNGDLKVPVELRQMIHCGGSCGYPGGCNNMSPAVPETDKLRITKLPAQLNLIFWRHKPESVNEPADMTYIIKFK